MPQQATGGVIERAPDLRPPLAGDVVDQYYEVDDVDGDRTWIRGDELVVRPGVVRVHAIAWRIR